MGVKNRPTDAQGPLQPAAVDVVRRLRRALPGSSATLFERVREALPEAEALTGGPGYKSIWCPIEMDFIRICCLALDVEIDVPGSPDALVVHVETNLILP